MHSRNARGLTHICWLEVMLANQTKLILRLDREVMYKGKHYFNGHSKRNLEGGHIFELLSLRSSNNGRWNFCHIPKYDVPVGLPYDSETKKLFGISQRSSYVSSAVFSTFFYVGEICKQTLEKLTQGVLTVH